MRRTATAVLVLGLFGTALNASAGEIPRLIWLRAKCALCHGEDGAGNTPEGKRREVPDLRSEAVQKLSDAELTKIISEGHSKMPSFKRALTSDQIAALVVYIRSFAKK